MITLLFLLLQEPISQAASESIIEKYGLPGFVIVILAFGYYKLLNRTNKIQDEMQKNYNKYIEEDRKELVNVISANTVAMNKLTDTMDQVVHRIEKIEGQSHR